MDDSFLDSLRNEVRTNHPTMAAALARIEAADAGIRAVRLWEDPMVGVAVMGAEVMMRRDDGDLMFSAEQALPRPKLYRAQKSKAAAERSVMRAEASSVALELETMVAMTAIELAMADEMIAIMTNQIAWVDSIAVNARQRLADPMGMAAEPLRMESELAQERQRLDTSEYQRVRLARELNILLGRPLDATWPAMRLPRGTADIPKLQAELDRLPQSNPMLTAQVQVAEAARAEIEVAKRERAPMFGVGVDTRVYSGGDFRETTVGAKMTLPWFNKSVYKATVDRAQREQEAARRQAEALERTLRQNAVAARTDAETAARQANTFSEQIIPRAEKANKALQDAWISSKATLLDVLDSRRAVLSARLEERSAVAAYSAALQKLRSIIPPNTQTPNP